MGDLSGLELVVNGILIAILFIVTAGVALSLDKYVMHHPYYTSEELRKIVQDSKKVDYNNI